MKTITSIAVAFGLTASVAAQSSTEGGTTATPTGPVVYVTFPGGLDSQVLVGSLVGTASQITTVVVGCPDGTDGSDCGFNPPVTMTAGPNTLRFVLSGLDDGPPFTEECSFNSNGGVCTDTGLGDLDATDTAATATDAPATTTTQSFGRDEITSVPITITAGETKGLGAGSKTSSSGSNPTSNAGNGGGNRGSSSSTTTSSTNDARILGPGAFGAALLGFAAIYL